MHKGMDGSRTTTSCWPSRSTAMISCATQSETQNRPSRQRGDSPNMRPDIKIFTSLAEDFNDIDNSLGGSPPCVLSGLFQGRTRQWCADTTEAFFRGVRCGTPATLNVRSFIR